MRASSRFLQHCKNKLYSQQVRFASTYGPNKLTANEFGAKHITSGVGRITNINMTKAEGAWVFDDQGNKFLDFTSGIGVVNTGHCHPKIVEAVQKQVSSLVHAQVNIGFHEPMLKLVEKLMTVTPKGLDSFFFWNSGAEAVEAAIKVAKYYTKKNNVVVVQGSYHGRTLGTMSMTTSKTVFSAGFGSLLSNIFVMPFPYHAQLPSGLTAEQMEIYCLEQFELLLKQQSRPEDTACVLIEPVLGEGGYTAPPQNYLRELKRLCSKHNILLIADEVQTGFGRTGKMFAVDHYDVIPDILIMAKGLASGYPLSGIVSTQEIMSSLTPGSMGGTYAGNAVSCAAALATLEVFEEEKILDNVNLRGQQLKSGLEKLSLKYPSSNIKEIRGHGLMIGMEFDKIHWKGSGIAGKVMAECISRNMLILTTSAFEVIRFIPPLTVTEDEVNQCLSILDGAFAAVFNE